MITISLCMIVKNEEQVLERCLNSVKELVDENVIVDTGSTDSTKEIARDRVGVIATVFEKNVEIQSGVNTRFEGARIS